MAIINPLTWNRPIVDAHGRPTKEFQIKWEQLNRAAGSIPSLATAAQVSGVLDILDDAGVNGSLLVRVGGEWVGYASPSNGAKFLSGNNPPTWQDVDDADVVFSDVLTNNASTTKHGYLPKLSGDDTQYLDGDGNWTTPAGGGGGGGGSGVERCLVELSADHTTTSNTWKEVTWGTVVSDDQGSWNAGVPKRLTVPSGYTRARVSAQIAWDNTGGGVRYHNVIHYDSGGSVIRQAALDIRSGNNESGTTLISPWLPVSAGDYFILEVNPGATAAYLPASGFAAPSKFQLEVAPAAAGGMPPFFDSPAFDPSTNSAGHGGSLFISRLLIPGQDFTLTSVKTYLRAFTGSNCYAGVYEAVASGALAGGTLLGQSTSGAATTGGVHTMTLNTPVDLVAGTAYWIGVCYIGGGTVTAAKMPSVPVRYFGHTTGTLPATAPATTAAASDFFGVWGA